MDYLHYYEKNKTFTEYVNDRLRKITDVVVDLKPENILDIGCGSGFLINLISKRVKANFLGIDVYEMGNKKLSFYYKKADITKGVPFGNSKFDCVILGEVIEHVPDPDFVLKEIRRVLLNGGHLIVSTPNLVSWANRILVLFGIQPLYTEVSSEVNLGRFFKMLGQGGKVQGHLRIFTFKSLEEILSKEEFILERKGGVEFFFPYPISLIDKFFTIFVPLASGLLYVARKEDSHAKR